MHVLIGPTTSEGAYVPKNVSSFEDLLCILLLVVFKIVVSSVRELHFVLRCSPLALAEIRDLLIIIPAQRLFGMACGRTELQLVSSHGWNSTRLLQKRETRIDNSTAAHLSGTVIMGRAEGWFLL